MPELAGAGILNGVCDMKNWARARLIAEQSLNAVDPFAAGPIDPGAMYEAQASAALSGAGLGRAPAGVLRLSGKGEGKPKQKLKGKVRWQKSGPWRGK